MARKTKVPDHDPKNFRIVHKDDPTARFTLVGDRAEEVFSETYAPMGYEIVGDDTDVTPPEEPEDLIPVE